MKSTIVIMRETILLLRRDNIFLPLILITLGIIWFGKTAGMWSIYEQNKFFFDISFAAIHISGALAAIFWSTKLFADSKQDGSLEQLIANPVSRANILLGRFLGLSFILALYAMVATICLSLYTKFYFGFGWLNFREIITILFFYESWIAIAAIGAMFASMGGHTTAFFSTLLLWFLGLTSGVFALALTGNEAEATRVFAEAIGKIWNFQNFNLSIYVGVKDFPSVSELRYRFLYGMTIVSMSLLIGGMFFNKKDATS